MFYHFQFYHQPQNFHPLLLLVKYVFVYERFSEQEKNLMLREGTKIEVLGYDKVHCTLRLQKGDFLRRKTKGDKE